MKSFISVAALALLASMPGVIAHIDMQDPPPIRHKNNDFATSIDNDYTAPIKELCKGYQKLGGADLTPVAKWEAGSTQAFTLGGSAVHGGGSCQASISEDGGNTFKAIKTYIGSCPSTEGAAGTFTFTVPTETKAGQVLFAWTWFNKVGNREMYMNCASIEITGGGSGLSTYPDILVANIGNGCSTVDNKDVEIPNPGKDVVTSLTADTAPPTGNCGPTGPAPPAGDSPKDTDGGAPPPPPVPPIVDTPKEDKKPIDAPPPPTTQPPASGSCTTGSIICASETTWSLCSNGTPVPMGSVAPGTKCVGGAITKRSPIRFSKDHMARKL